QTGTVAGLDPAALAFRLIEPEVALSVERPDGSSVAAGQVIATVSGPARALLTAERTALNLLCHLSGVASATASVVAAISGHK
ncbi:nicotinate-nucleotide diphosphorylase (carboxylating), partial [Acinetobacter baumannii]